MNILSAPGKIKGEIYSSLFEFIKRPPKVTTNSSFYYLKVLLANPQVLAESNSLEISLAD